jgi:hypothetical protein
MMVRLYKMTFAILLIHILRICDSLSDLERQSAQELRDNKKALMKSLGLQYVPRTVPIQSDLLLRRYSAPKFMMGLFKEVSYDVNRTDEHYEIERKFLDENKVNTVISFFKYGKAIYICTIFLVRSFMLFLYKNMLSRLKTWYFMRIIS